METTQIKLSKQIPSIQENIVRRKRTGQWFIDNVVSKVLKGEIVATFATIQLKQILNAITLALKKIEPQTVDELEGLNHYSYGDVKIQHREGTRVVDYSDCPEVVKMEEHLKKLKDHLKHALVGVEKGTTTILENRKFVDTNGEIRNLPKWKYRKGSVVMSKV